MNESRAAEMFFGLVCVISLVALCICIAWRDTPAGYLETEEMTPIGARNHNPLNLEPLPGKQYNGIAIPAAIGGKCNFLIDMWGFRAAFLNYIHKADRGINTIRKLLTEWSPPGGDNITASDPTGQRQLDGYISQVCERSGIGPDEVIDLKSWAAASQVCYAQVVVECGSFDAYFKRADMEQGAFRAGIVDAPAPLTHKIAARVTSTGATGIIVAGAIQPHIEAALAADHRPWIQGLLVCASIAAVVYLGYMRQHVKES